MHGNTITLSNFGMIGGKYSAPIVMPPTVAVLSAGRIVNRLSPSLVFLPCTACCH